MTLYDSLSDAELKNIMEHKQNMLEGAMKSLDGINAELQKRRAEQQREQQRRLEFAKLATRLRRLDPTTLSLVLFDSVPTILDALDLAASCEPQRTE